MRIYESGTTTYWLNYFAESIKDGLESKGGRCKIQVSFTGNILFVRGYSNINDVSVDDIFQTVVDENPELHNIFGQGLRNNIIYLSDFPSDVGYKLCHTYYNNPNGRPIFNPNHQESSLVSVSEFPFGCSLEFKSPIYYGEYISRDLLKFTKSDLVHIDYKGDEELSLQVTSIYPKKSVESCVLDIYDFNFKKFEEQLKGFDFKQEILEPYGDRPWLKNFKLSEYIIF